MRQVLGALALWCACISAGMAETVAFGLFGDTPYNTWERETLPRLMQQMDDDKLGFVIHVGDIKSGASRCSDEALTDIRDLFQSSATPLIYVPGDNEWTDCHRLSNGSYDPLERLAKLRQLFFTGDSSLGRTRIPLERQSRDPRFGEYRENVRWERGRVLFLGLNMPGSNNNYRGPRSSEGEPSNEFTQRSAANRQWLADAFALAKSRQLAGILIALQANPEFKAAGKGRPLPGYRDFLGQLLEETRNFGKPVVLVHGDTHDHRIDQPLKDPLTGQRIGNLTRVETYGSPGFGWVRGTADAADPQVFRFEARPWVRELLLQ